MCEEANAVIDFNDMILAPLVLGDWEVIEYYDWVIFDEAQDLSETRRLIAAGVLKRGGRFVCIGDKFQSIYQFAGATSGSMDLVKKRFHSTVFPLSVTYRAPKP